MRIARMVTWVVIALGSGSASADEPVPPASPPAPAQPPPPPSPPPTPVPDAGALATAKLHFEQGVQLYNDGNYSAALAEFETSHRLNPVPFVQKNIGYTQQRLFLYVEAIESLRAYLAASPNAPDTAEVEQIIRELQALLVEARLAIEPATGVTVIVDGREIGTTPLARPLVLAVGTHAIELRAEGYEPVKRSVMVANGVPLDLKAQLRAIPKTGKVRIQSPVARATVSIDGRPAGTVPLELELGGGGHTLELTAPDHRPHRGELVITVGQTREVTIPLDRVVVVKRERAWYTKWYVLGGIGAAAVGAGVGALVLTGGTEDPLPGTLSPGAGRIR